MLSPPKAPLSGELRPQAVKGGYRQAAVTGQPPAGRRGRRPLQIYRERQLSAGFRRGGVTPPYVQPIKRCAVGISGGFLCTSKSASPRHRGWRS